MTRTKHTARYYAAGFAQALDCAIVCRKMVDTLADMDRTGAMQEEMICAEITRLLSMAAEYEREAEVWIEDAAANGYGPDDFDQ